MSDRPAVFGTDGVRDRAGEGLLALDSVRRLVQAMASVLRERHRFPDEFPAGTEDIVYIGRDTRESGQGLLDQAGSEFQRQSFAVRDLGILPTAGVAHAASVSSDCSLAIVLSASHNAADYNGIKLLSPNGAKISSRFEDLVSERYFEIRDPGEPSAVNSFTDVGPDLRVGDAAEEYVRFLVSRSWRPERLRGKRVVLDTAHGAAFRVAPQVFRSLGMDVVCLGDAPNGRNINDGCGALHPEALADRLRSSGAGIGFCFDGDADRVIPVTASGKVLDGDYILALAGRHYHRSGKLPRESIVATVMSNLGLQKALEKEGLRLIRTQVGDRYVYQRLIDEGHPVGGEQSGHILFMDDFPTGDGILAAIRLLDVLETDDLDLDAEAVIMTQYPQILRNVGVKERVPFDELPEVTRVVREVEERLAGDGRVLLRYSGTEPLARVMLEGLDRDLIEGLCDRICRAIREAMPA